MRKFLVHIKKARFEVKKLIHIIVIGLTSFLITSAYSEGLNPNINHTQETPPLRVGIVNHEFFPFLIHVNQNEFMGYTIDWWKAWSQANARPIEWVYLSQNEAANALTTKKIDVIDLSLQQTQPAEFVQLPYQSLDISLYAFNTKRELSELAGVMVGSIRGDLCEAVMHSAENKTHTFANYMALFNALTEQQVDAICLDSATAANLLNKFQFDYKLFKSEPLKTINLSRVYLATNTEITGFVEHGATIIPKHALEALNQKWLGKQKFQDLKLPVSAPLILGLSGIFAICLFVIVELRSRYRLATKSLENTLAKREQDLETIEEKHAYIKNIIELWPELVFEMNEDLNKIRVINERSFERYSKGDFKKEFEFLLNQKHDYFKSIVGKVVQHGMHKVSEMAVVIANTPLTFEMVFVKKSHEHDRYPILVFTRDRTSKIVAELEQKLSAIFFSKSHEAMCITNPLGQVVKVNDAFTTITGYSSAEVVGQNMHLLSSGKHDKAFFMALWTELQTTGTWHGEIWNKKKNGDLYLEWLTISTIYNEEGKPQYRTAIFIDITEIRQAEEKLYQQAHYDSVTNLPNRINFTEAIESRVVSAAAQHSKFCLYFIDLDHFKEVNDTMGHHVGDLLLQEVAKRISETIYPVKLYRFGGDEFLFISSYIDDKFHQVIAQKILDELKRPFLLRQEKIYISVSVGISYYPEHGKTSSTLIKHADQALYEAKNLGRNQYVIFNDSLQDKAQARKKLINHLRQACERMDQFELYYQPIVCMQSMAVMKAEALIRWHHPTMGAVPPADFIPLAEQSGLIEPIGNWVFLMAAKQAHTWRDNLHGHFQISINESPLQFAKAKEVHSLWFNLLATLKLDPSAIVLEITEGVMMDTTDKANAIFEDLNNKGIQVALDDFGTGFSSLSYLKKLDIDYIKIDQSFTRDLPSNANDRSLCEAMIKMAHTLNLKVIAEGIENLETHEILKGMQCDFGQGYFYSKPINAETFTNMYAPEYGDGVNNLLH